MIPGTLDAVDRARRAGITEPAVCECPKPKPGRAEVPRECGRCFRLVPDRA